MLFETMIRALMTPQSKCEYGVDHMTCYGNDFLVCGPTSVWTFMACGEGTSCNDSGASIFCDYEKQTVLGEVGVSSVEPEECDSSRLNLECVGDNFRTCDNGKWVNMKCPAGTTCRTDPIIVLVCDTLPASPIGVQVASEEEEEVSDEAFDEVSFGIGIASLNDALPVESTEVLSAQDMLELEDMGDRVCSKDGEYKCMGDNYAICQFGEWLQQDCGEGTKCMQTNDTITCG